MNDLNAKYYSILHKQYFSQEGSDKRSCHRIKSRINYAGLKAELMMSKSEIAYNGDILIKWMVLRDLLQKTHDK